MNYQIRELKPEEYSLLDDFLYESIFQKDEDNPLPKDIIKQPELQVYIKGFGQEKEDACLCALVKDAIVGMVWVRNIEGYGSVDAQTPEFAISLYREYRGYGIGTALMKQMLDLLKQKGYSKASLAVQKENKALKMYQKIGFQIMDENAEEFIMVYHFNS